MITPQFIEARKAASEKQREKALADTLAAVRSGCHTPRDIAVRLERTVGTARHHLHRLVSEGRVTLHEGRYYIPGEEGMEEARAECAIMFHVKHTPLKDPTPEERRRLEVLAADGLVRHTERGWVLA